MSMTYWATQDLVTNMIVETLDLDQKSLLAEGDRAFSVSTIMKHKFKIDARGFVEEGTITHETGVIKAETLLFHAGFSRYNQYDVYDPDTEKKLEVVDLKKQDTFLVE